MAWIRTIPWSEAEGLLKEAYDWQAAKLGRPSEYTTLGSLYPELVYERLRLYKTVEGCPSGLSPVERQVANLVTSVLNRTPHCGSGSTMKLQAMDVDPELVEAINADPRTARSGDPRLDAIIAYAVKLTLEPGGTTERDLEALRAHGLSDLDLLDLNNRVAYFCYTNRVANGLGLKSTIGSLREATLSLPR